MGQSSCYSFYLMVLQQLKLRLYNQKMSQAIYQADGSSRIYDMFAKDLAFSLGDPEYFQTSSLCHSNPLFDTQQVCSQQMPYTQSELSSYKNAHLYRPQPSNTYKTQPFSKITEEQEGIIEYPIVVQHDALTRPSQHKKHQQYHPLSPHGICQPQDEETLSLATGPVISQFISISGNSEGSLNSESNQGSNTMPSENLLISTHQDNSSQPNQKPTKGRKDDSNNAHKKLITLLNSTLQNLEKRKLNAQISLLQSKYSIALKCSKCSRYGFIQLLLTLRQIFGAEFMLNLFEKFILKLDQFVQKIRKEPQSLSNDLLLNLPIHYKKSFSLFLDGYTRDSIEQLYVMMPNFKQNAYMLKGIQKVEQLERDLLSLKK